MKKERNQTGESASKGCGCTYRCTNCGTLHHGENPPESCMKCDGKEFRKCTR